MKSTASTDSLVFVVDDDRSMRVAVERLLRSSGLQVEPFASAREFLERAPADVACCVVLDVRMPELTGLDLQQALRQSDADIPIVFITGHGDVPTISCRSLSRTGNCWMPSTARLSATARPALLARSWPSSASDSIL